MNRRTTLVVALVSCCLLSTLSVVAEPVPEGDRVPVDLRRTTLIVEDMDASLALYRDAIGMEVLYDNTFRTPRDAKSDEEARSVIHLVFLRANDDFVGILGLMEFIKPVKTPPEQMPAPFGIGGIVLMFNTDDLGRDFEKVKGIPGVKVLSEPRETSFPSYDGKGTIPVLVSVLVDPDGHVVEFNQLLIDREEMLK